MASKRLAYYSIPEKCVHSIGKMWLFTSPEWFGAGGLVLLGTPPFPLACLPWFSPLPGAWPEEPATGFQSPCRGRGGTALEDAFLVKDPSSNPDSSQSPHRPLID